MTSELYLGVETGGTKVVCRIVNANGQTVDEARIPSTTPEAVAHQIVERVEQATAKGARVAGLGLASFGPVVVDPASPRLGQMLATPKPGWSGSNLFRALAERLGCPGRIDTDVNAAALAEQALGAGKGLHTVAYVTVGTGIGGGLALDGRTLKGGLHPEIGHIPMRRAEGDDLISACPFHPACAEGLAAGPAVQQRLAGRRLEDAPEVRALVANYLGQVCATLLLTWSPQRIVLGGGVMSTPGLVPEIEARMRIALNHYGAAIVAEAPGYVAAAELEHAGLEGALILARQAAGAG
jgi:fructokinase